MSHRVTYRRFDDNTSALSDTHTSHEVVEEFDDIDDGYDRVEKLRKSWWAWDVQWGRSRD